MNLIKPLCIYHGNCADGFGAAWAVWKALEGGVELCAGVDATSIEGAPFLSWLRIHSRSSATLSREGLRSRSATREDRR